MTPAIMKWHPLINVSTFCLYQLEVCLIFRRDFVFLSYQCYLKWEEVKPEGRKSVVVCFVLF